MTDRHQIAEAHAFRNGYIEERLHAAWKKLQETNKIIKNLTEHGKTWRDLPPHLIDDLIRRAAAGE